MTAEAGPGVDRPACVLVGPPGAGKTTVGGLIADALRVPFLDTDALIERSAGKPIPEIFFDEGEDHFRVLERAAVAEALAGHRGVLALGGGAVLADDTRELLMEHLVVYLSVELADAAKRVGLGASRPLLAVNPRATMRHLLDARRPLYEEVADVVVPTDGIDPEQVAETVLLALSDPEVRG
ncbi:shikimate kinase [Actinocatenispora rupis]|uniref:Shikimate kinase n=1 Tax=Actinocatenispora rupis TaxID=519421 RepID=A0A8J3NEE9_9ACTN|nr:shikimate kinase [Actinocatenispora rupis]GID12509.1 shikimate kinase [Actinocatenispora rupis]